MKQSISLIVTVLFMLVLVSCALKRPNYLIVPGESVGGIKADTSEEDLGKLFKRENIIPCELSIGDDESVSGTLIYSDDPSNSIAIVWKDPKLKTNIREVRFLGSKTRFKTAEGVTLGSTLKELEALNANRFSLMGFAWDYEGTFTNSNQGNLSYLDRNGAIGYGENSGKMLIRLQPAEISGDTEQVELYKTVLGDREYSSDIPAMQSFNPVVYEMIVYFH